MYVAIESLRIVGILLLPFLTTKAPVILTQLGIPKDTWVINKETMTFGWLKQGAAIGTEREILFQRVEVEKPQPIVVEKKEKKEK